MNSLLRADEIHLRLILVSFLLVALLGCSGDPPSPPEGATKWGLAAKHDDLKLLAPLEGSSERPAWSPDGTMIAFEYMESRLHQGGIDPDSIYLIEADGTGVRALLLGGGKFSCDKPDWSPGSRQLVASCNVDGDYDLYILDVPTGTVHQLTNLPGDQMSPAWSPDGTLIAFESVEEKTSIEGTFRRERRIYVTDVDGASPVPLTQGPCDSTPAWAPDGRGVSFSLYCGTAKSLCITDVDGSSLRCIDDIFCSSNAWAPDHGLIACASGSNIVGIDPETGTLITLLHTGSGFIGGLSWSPDGEFIVFSHGEIGRSSSDLYLLKVNP